jgi:hypothetical protein
VNLELLLFLLLSGILGLHNLLLLLVLAVLLGLVVVLLLVFVVRLRLLVLIVGQLRIVIVGRLGSIKAQFGRAIRRVLNLSVRHAALVYESKFDGAEGHHNKIEESEGLRIRRRPVAQNRKMKGAYHACHAIIRLFHELLSATSLNLPIYQFLFFKKFVFMAHAMRRSSDRGNVDLALLLGDLLQLLLHARVAATSNQVRGMP